MGGILKEQSFVSQAPGADGRNCCDGKRSAIWKSEVEVDVQRWGCGLERREICKCVSSTSTSYLHMPQVNLHVEEGKELGEGSEDSSDDETDTDSEEDSDETSDEDTSDEDSDVGSDEDTSEESSSEEDQDRPPFTKRITNMRGGPAWWMRFDVPGSRLRM